MQCGRAWPFRQAMLLEPPNLVQGRLPHGSFGYLYKVKLSSLCADVLYIYTYFMIFGEFPKATAWLMDLPNNPYIMHSFKDVLLLWAPPTPHTTSSWIELDWFGNCVILSDIANHIDFFAIVLGLRTVMQKLWKVKVKIVFLLKWIAECPNCVWILNL